MSAPTMTVRRDDQDEWLREVGQLGKHHHCAGGCFKIPPVGYVGRHAAPRHYPDVGRPAWCYDRRYVAPPTVIGPAGYPSYRGRHRSGYPRFNVDMLKLEIAERDRREASQ